MQLHQSTTCLRVADLVEARLSCENSSVLCPFLQWLGTDDAGDSSVFMYVLQCTASFFGGRNAVAVWPHAEFWMQHDILLSSGGETLRLCRKLAHKFCRYVMYMDSSHGCITGTLF